MFIMHDTYFLICHGTFNSGHLFQFFMLSLSDSNQTDIIEALNSTSRYLNDLLNIDNPHFEQMVGQIYPTKLQ